MKILYAIQGTGNGHLARATEIIPHLQKFGEVDILISGIQGDIRLPFEIKYRFYGLSFIFGEKGGIDFWKTLIRLRPFQLLSDIFRLPVESYDLVLNDFEPISAWACKLRGKRCIGLSHQNAVLHKIAPRPGNRDFLGETILKYYAPSDIKYGFHFKQFDPFNFTPVIRFSIRQAKPDNSGHYTVYLPAYSDEKIISLLQGFSRTRWEVFSKHCKLDYQVGNLSFHPISFDRFNQSFINCEGILCNAGFETPAEAIFMGKKLCVIPMKNQFEQSCNAALLSEMGVRVIEKGADIRAKIGSWLVDDSVIRIPYPDHTGEIVQELVSLTESQSYCLL